MCRRASPSVSKNMYDVTTRPGLVQRDFTVSKCVAKSVSLFLSVCLCVCKSVGLFLTCVLECVKECLYVYECWCVYATVCLSSLARCLRVSKSVSTDFYDVTTCASLVQGDCTGFHRGCTLWGHHFCTPRAHGGILRATFLASNLLVGFHPVFAFISQLKMHFEV